MKSKCVAQIRRWHQDEHNEDQCSPLWQSLVPVEPAKFHHHNRHNILQQGSKLFAMHTATSMGYQDEDNEQSSVAVAKTLEIPCHFSEHCVPSVARCASRSQLRVQHEDKKIDLQGRTSCQCGLAREYFCCLRPLAIHSDASHTIPVKDKQDRSFSKFRTA